MRKGAWVGFWTLGLLWGSSFMLIRISVQEVNPFQLVFTRVGIAAVGLLALQLLRGKRIPTDVRALVPLVIIGIGNTAIPFLLISWGETIIESSMASILQSTASLFTLIVAHFFFEDERMSSQRVGGMLAGFLGVVVLFSANIEGGRVLLTGVLGQLAIVVASMFYATFTTYSRTVLQRQKVEPMTVAAVSMASAAVVMGTATFISPLVGGPSPVWLTDVSRTAATALIALSVFNTLAAYGIFYFIVASLGASRAAMVTYVVPVVGLILGVVFLNEPLTWHLLVGAALILGGIGIVNLPRTRKQKARDAAKATASS
jgi:drug/metabolite transporter (DMT)-like permease